jgi:hypothetical protein
VGAILRLKALCFRLLATQPTGLIFVSLAGVNDTKFERVITLILPLNVSLGSTVQIFFILIGFWILLGNRLNSAMFILAKLQLICLVLEIYLGWLIWIDLEILMVPASQTSPISPAII